MKLFSRDNPARPLIFFCLGYIVVGYALFFAALALPTPAWGPGLMAWCASIIKAIHTAMQVGLLKSHDPFPIQLVILYCALGTLFLVLYSAYFIFFNDITRKILFDDMISHTRETNSSRVREFFMGLGILLVLIWMLHFSFFRDMPNIRSDTSWRTIIAYYPGWFAPSLFLVTSLMSMLINLSIATIYLACSKRLNSSTVIDKKESSHGQE